MVPAHQAKNCHKLQKVISSAARWPDCQRKSGVATIIGRAAPGARRLSNAPNVMLLRPSAGRAEPHSLASRKFEPIAARSSKSFAYSPPRCLERRQPALCIFRKGITMKQSVLYKVAAVMAVLALGGVSISHDALAKGGSGGGGGGMGGGHFGGGGGVYGGWVAVILAAVAVISVTAATSLVAISTAGIRGNVHDRFGDPLLSAVTVITVITTPTAGAFSTGVASGFATRRHSAVKAAASCMIVRLAAFLSHGVREATSTEIDRL